MHQGGDFDATGCSNGRGDPGGPDATGRATCTQKAHSMFNLSAAPVLLLHSDHATDGKGTASSRGFCSGYPSYRLLPVVLNWSPYSAG